MSTQLLCSAVGALSWSDNPSALSTAALKLWQWFSNPALGQHWVCWAERRINHFYASQMLLWVKKGCLNWASFIKPRVGSYSRGVQPGFVPGIKAYIPVRGLCSEEEDGWPLDPTDVLGNSGSLLWKWGLAMMYPPSASQVLCPRCYWTFPWVGLSSSDSPS